MKPLTDVIIAIVANKAGFSTALGTANKERNMKSALVSAMRLNGDSHADESIVTWETTK